MKAKKLEVGDFVRVLKIPTSDVDERFIGKRAIVMKIYDNDQEGGPIGVVFAPWYKYLNNYPHQNSKNVIVRFLEEELKIDKPWKLSDPEYGAYYFEIITGCESKKGLPSLIKKEFPFLPGICNCMIEGCKNKAITRIFYRDCGPVNEAYVCKEHTNYNGIWREFLPIKEDYKLFDIIE